MHPLQPNKLKGRIMARKVKYIPKGYHTLTSAIAVKGAAKALDFYKKIFGAKVLLKLDGPKGSIVHSEIQIGDSILMISDEDPNYNRSPKSVGSSTVVFSLYVEDVDKTIKKAVKAGAKIIIPAADQFYGDRSGRIRDPFGHVWIISTHIEDVSPQEMNKRFTEMMKKG